MITPRLLIFPIDLDTGKDFAFKARALNFPVVGASSETTTRDRALVDDFISLPFITDSRFSASFINALKRHNITHVYAPHAGVWTHLNNLRTCKPDQYKFHLCSPAPFEADWQEYTTSYDWAEVALHDSLAERLASPAVVKSKLKLGQYAGLHKQFTRTPGQCDDEKLLSLTAIAQLAPEGDVVEIGVLYGRSAFALGWLAEKYGIGNTICVDPWQLEEMEDQGKNAEILNSRLVEIDSRKVFNVFIANAVLLNNVGYIRKHSVDAIVDYRFAGEKGFLVSEELGQLSVSGKISILHIDGSHKYEEVIKDIQTWAPYIVPGGWLLLDDYVWSFGDGPQRAGDELISTGSFDITFCLGDTLFLRKK